jgi:hypothetical protein
MLAAVKTDRSKKNSAYKDNDVYNEIKRNQEKAAADEVKIYIFMC